MNEDFIEIVASIGQPAEITSEITGEAHIDAVVDASTTEFVAEIVAAGPRGPQGDQGPQGIPGQDGQDGADGADGVSPEVTVASITGGHSVTITDADHPGGQTFNVMDGTDGQDGAAATITVGTVSGLPAGSAPTVVNSGTANAAVFDFGIPKGDKGDTGNTGATGPTGPGVPDGGAAATILRKRSATDQDTEWYPPFIPYAAVDGTSTSTAFTATVPGITKLEHGVMMFLKNGVVTSASGFTIDVNGLGAKPSYSNLSAATADTTLFNVNYTMLFIFDETRVAGGCWVCYRGYNSDTNTIGYQLRTNNTILKTSDACRYYKIFFTSADGTHWVPAAASTTNSATSAKTVNQRKIDPWGRIAYNSATTSYAAEADIAAATLWSQYEVTLGYSFNWTGAALTLTAKAPVYVKCAPQSDGSAIMDDTTPIVQALPSSEDGKIYIFLGVATSATKVEIYPVHPVYYYKSSAIRLWTNAPSGGGGGSTDIFWATYGSTSVADIDSALAADQVPCVLKDNVVYVYGYAVDDKRYFGSTVLQSLSYKYLVNDNGTWSAANAPMHGIPSGGTTGQVLAKSSGTDYDAGWVTPPAASSATPQALGTAAAGSSGDFSRADHVHAMPSNTDVGVGYKIYDTVTDIGLTSGSATIPGAYSAMPDSSMLICASSNFLATSVPSTVGIVVIVKIFSSRGYIWFYGKRSTDADYRMFLNDSNAPDGTWVPERPNNITGVTQNLLTNNDSANPYICPTDGYAVCYCTSGSVGTVNVCGAGQTSAYVQIGNELGRHSVFVRAGMKLWYAGSPNTARFAGLS